MPSFSLGDQQRVREPLPFIGPRSRDREAGRARDPLELRGGVLVPALGVDRLPLGEGGVEAEGVDAHALLLAADEVHLDPRALLVVERAVGEAVEAEMAAELAVDAA